MDRLGLEKAYLHLTKHQIIGYKDNQKKYLMRQKKSPDYQMDSATQQAFVRRINGVAEVADSTQDDRDPNWSAWSWKTKNWSIIRIFMLLDDCHPRFNPRNGYTSEAIDKKKEEFIQNFWSLMVISDALEYYWYYSNEIDKGNRLSKSLEQLPDNNVPLKWDMETRIKLDKFRAQILELANRGTTSFIRTDGGIESYSTGSKILDPMNEALLRDPFENTHNRYSYGRQSIPSEMMPRGIPEAAFDLGVQIALETGFKNVPLDPKTISLKEAGEYVRTGRRFSHLKDDPNAQRLALQLLIRNSLERSLQGPERDIIFEPIIEINPLLHIGIHNERALEGALEKVQLQHTGPNSD